MPSDMTSMSAQLKEVVTAAREHDLASVLAGEFAFDLET